MILLIMLGITITFTALVTVAAWYFDIKYLDQIDDIGIDD